MTTLSNHDYIIAIDLSGSMGTIDPGHTKTRLQRAEESVIGLDRITVKHHEQTQAQTHSCIAKRNP